LEFVTGARSQKTRMMRLPAEKEAWYL